MKRIETILQNSLYREAMETINRLEKDRIFCRHGITHSLDVARIARILSLEQALQIPADVIYAAAILHDIGRGCEYQSGISHEEAGYQIAREILKQTEFTQTEQDAILEAIHMHRGRTDEAEPSDLPGLLKKADNLSRLCFDCEAYEACFWPNDKKNHTILY